MSRPQPTLLLEINEVPWRVLNRYRPQFKNINAFFTDAKELTTTTVDEGELSPWVTWPTMHRGLPNTEHKVFNLGQDPSTFRGVPIWDEYLQRGYSVGVFGSMQSWPPKNPGPKGFYVPDTFAHDEKCIPEWVEPLQRFNLDQVAQNGRVVAASPLKRAMDPKFIKDLLKAGVTFRTILRLVAQVVGERLNPDLRARRPIFQTILFWDVFKKLYNPKHPPEFTTFFTNHIAGVMHRYWNHLFPEDFPQDLKPKAIVHDQTMLFAMSVLDEILKDVNKWQTLNPELSVIFATSMGQGPVFRTGHHGFEAVVKDLPRLLEQSGLSASDYKTLLAMVPQVAAEIASDKLRGQTKSFLENLSTPSNHKLFSVQEIGQSLSITLKNPPEKDCRDQMVILPNGSKLSFEDIGIKVWATDAGTAYHIPEGICAIKGPLKGRFANVNDTFPADKFKMHLMNATGLSGQSSQSSTSPNVNPKDEGIHV